MRSKSFPDASWSEASPRPSCRPGASNGRSSSELSASTAGRFIAPLAFFFIKKEAIYSNRTCNFKNQEKDIF
jgi:hypothetical protein